ncbi:VanW family protein [Murimonas intestini]|uniref:Vancomycin resistance protein YoaR n=1 Tax=Murimonas intestini TaxID=1337051 RepID=A0AB73T182_9FIRM|nr:VanW family protein [Murimonas intestini]MCR1840476.1 VanW family protein [Murimonas intestini]MCR1867413.1 VanW family protein [Murimonas intestini]MCR1884600.1 VanW family protein [Murimonas intestini]
MKLRRMLLTAAALSLAVLSGGLFSVQADASDSAGTINKGVYIGGVDVSGMTVEEASQAVEAKVAEMGNTKVTLRVADKQLDTTAAELGLTWENKSVVNEAAGLGKSGNLIKRYKDNKDLENETKTFNLTYTTDSSKLASFVNTECVQLNCEAQDGSLTRENGYFEIVPGVTGVKVDVDKSVKAITDYMDTAFNGSPASIQLAAEEVKPKGTEEELSKVQDVLGTATTYYGSTYGRNVNVEVGAQRLNGHLLYPGDSFSVTDAVVPFTAENGYELAPSYESGKVVDSYGGGICQVSTTLYNAVLKSELDVLARSNHTMTVSYVDPSKDAAIAEGLMDLVFQNNTDAPIYIEGYAYGGELTFTIYGHETRPADRVVEYVSEVTSRTTPEGVKLYAKPDQNVGYVAQIQSAMEGLTAVLWKNVYYNGETETTQVNSSFYQATPTSYEIGTATDDPSVSAAIYEAIAANDLDMVNSIIANGAGGTGQSETEAPPETEAPTEATEAPQTDAPQTEAPQTDAPQTDATEAPVENPPAEEQVPSDAPQGYDENGQPIQY